MGGDRRGELVRHLSERELDRLLDEADDPKIIKRLYKGATYEEAADDVGKSASTGSRWARRWNDGGLGETAHNKRPDGEDEGWILDDDICTDGGTVVGFCDASHPQPYDNSHRLWYVDDPTLERPLVRLDEPAVGCYTLNGESVLTFPEDQSKELW